MKKYEFTGEEKKWRGRTLKRIRRLRDGLMGGWIEKEENLIHYGSCFVFDSALVFDSARVSDSALVKNDQEVCSVYDCVSISGLSYAITIMPWAINIGCKTYEVTDLDEIHTEIGETEVSAIKAIVEATLSNMHEKIGKLD